MDQLARLSPIPESEPSNQVANHAARTDRSHRWRCRYESSLTRLVHHTREGMNLPAGGFPSLCNNVGRRLGTKSTSIKTNVNSHGRARNDSRHGRYVKLYVPVPTYVSYDWNRRTVMRIHNAEFGLTPGLRFGQGTRGNTRRARLFSFL